MSGSETDREFGGEAPERADVVVVGGGIAGVATAFHLTKANVDVALLEASEIGGGATAAAVGVLSPPLRQPYHETVHDHGGEAARSVWEFAARSVAGLGDALEKLGGAEEAELDLSGGWVLAERHTAHELEDACRALEEAGFGVEWVAADVVQEKVGGRGFTGALRLRPGGSLNARAATRILARAARRDGARIVEGVEVREVVRNEGGGLRCVTADGGEVRCEMVVYATHVKSRRFSQLLGDEIVPIRGQGLTLELPRPFRAAGSFSTHWKLNVWRRSPRSSGRVFLGGWRHDAWDRAYWKVRPEIDRHLQSDLVTWFASAFPELGEPEVTARWSGIFGWTADYFPLLGPLPGVTDELVVGGFSGGGLPFAFESGRAVAHVVAGKEPVPGASLFNPRRFL